MNKRGKNKKGYQFGVIYQEEMYKKYTNELEEFQNCLIKAFLLVVIIPIILFIILL